MIVLYKQPCQLTCVAFVQWLHANENSNVFPPRSLFSRAARPAEKTPKNITNKDLLLFQPIEPVNNTRIRIQV